MTNTMLAAEPQTTSAATAADRLDELRRASQRVWPIVVIGAGPAGAVAARQLAPLVGSVLLVDRKPVPRPKVCGACINGSAVSELARIGLLRVVQGNDSVPLRELHVWSGTCQLRVPLPIGAVMARDQFDTALVNAAIEAGATILTKTVATVRSATGDSRTIELRQDSNAIEVRARVVLVADGLGRPSLAGHGEFRTISRPAGRIGSGCVVAAPAGNLAPGVIGMAVGRHGYVGMVRLSDGRLNVAAALDPDWVAACGGLGGAADQVVNESGMLRAPSLSNESWRGTPALTQRPNSVAGNRLFIVGDAAGYVEPFTGDGIAAAIRSATAVVPLADAGSRRWNDSLADDWTATYRNRVAWRQLASSALAWSLRSPLLVRCGIRSLGRLPNWLEWLAAGVSGPSPLAKGISR